MEENNGEKVGQKLARADGRVICFFYFLVEKRLNFDYDKFIKGG